MTVAQALVKPIYLQNEQAGPVVFKDEKDQVEIVWEGKGSNTGLDFQAVPVSLLSNTNFLRILSRGILSLAEADEETTALVNDALESPALNRQAELYKKAQDDKTDAIAPVDHTKQNDLIATGCIGPSTRGGGNCGVEIPIKQSEAGEKAPLCALHKSLEKFAVPTETDEIRDGKPVYTWSLVSI